MPLGASVVLIIAGLVLLLAYRFLHTDLPGRDIADFVLYPVCIMALIAFGVVGGAVSLLAG